MADRAPDGISESGNPVYRHVRQKPFEAAVGDPESIEKIEKHLGQHLGEPATVFHEIVSDLVHIDVHVITPRPDRNYYTLVSTGMSDRPMNVPQGLENFAHLELLLCLPPSWPIDEKLTSFKDERNYWPVRLLKTLARLPHEYDTWLGLHHTVPHGDPATPFAEGTQLSGAMITIPKLVPDKFASLQVRPDKRVWFLAVTPLYSEEMDFKLRKGGEALDALLDKGGVTELIDPQRKNVCRKKFLGLF